jgi:hypothetical protein
MIMSIEKLCEDVLDVIEMARGRVFRAANVAVVRSYWEIGRLMVEGEQNGDDRAAYGKQVVELLSLRLQSIYGKGYNKTNLWYMRQFYRLFENPHALRGELSWTHYRLLLKIEEKVAGPSIRRKLS